MQMFNNSFTTESRLQWSLHMLQFIVAQKMEKKHQSNNITAAGS